MIVQTKAIVISAIKFQENSLVVKCFTLSEGLKSYFVRDAFSSRKGSQKMAYFQPMTLLEVIAIHKNKGTLEQLKEIKIDKAFTTIHSDVIKSAIALFLSEMLHHSIYEEERNDVLFNFIESALYWFDLHDEISNFHLIFLLEITKHLGFYPDISDIHAPFFEMKEGVFSANLSLTSLNEHETLLLKKLIELKFDSTQKTFHVSERQVLLRILVDYYAWHLEGFKKPKSLEILKEVFS